MDCHYFISSSNEQAWEGVILQPKQSKKFRNAAPYRYTNVINCGIPHQVSDSSSYHMIILMTLLVECITYNKSICQKLGKIILSCTLKMAKRAVTLYYTTYYTLWCHIKVFTNVQLPNH